MKKCKLSLDIRKNAMLKNNVWCSIIIEYKAKALFNRTKTYQIESTYNNASMSIDELSNRIEACGGVKGFMLDHIESKVKISTKQTREDLIIKKLMDSKIEVEISESVLKILRK